MATIMDSGRERRAILPRLDGTWWTGLDRQSLLKADAQAAPPRRPGLKPYSTGAQQLHELLAAPKDFYRPADLSQRPRMASSPRVRIEVVLLFNCLSECLINRVRAPKPGRS